MVINGPLALARARVRLLNHMLIYISIGKPLGISPYIIAN